ncbi:MAG: C-GCAxxG-C-C family protein [Smithellaceae bacterium]
MTQEKSREELLNEIEKKAGDYEVLWDSCAQGTLAALQEAFNLGDENSLKAATAMPGIALRGETCGAVIGSIMALGIAFGRKNPTEDEKLVTRTVGAARKLCRRFEEEFGSCNCRDVQHKVFGRTFNFADPADWEAFEKADAGQKCRNVAGKAARIASELILGPAK